MTNEFEDEIRNEVFSDKLNNFFKKYKKIIILVSILIISIPICLQFYLFFQNQKKQTLLSEYLKAEVMIDTNEDQENAIKILKKLAKENNDTISALSLGKLINYYLEKGDRKAVLEFIRSNKLNSNKEIFKEIKIIKEVILNFETLNEDEILNLLKVNNDNIFKIIKNKLLIDFYIKNKQFNKADQIKKQLWK